MTDLKGRFSAGDLPGGVYKVKISLPQGLMSYSPEREIKVADRGCAMVNFDVVSDGRLIGRVLDIGPVFNATFRKRGFIGLSFRVATIHPGNSSMA